MRHVHIYRLLKSAGHTPWKAGEILLDAERGDPWSREWIAFFYHTRR